MECSQSAFIRLLEQHQCSRFGVYKGHEIWITKEKLVIQVPIDKKVHYDIIEEVALNIIGMNNWDLDYWLGQNHLN